MSTLTHSIPKHLITGPNCIAVPNAWAYSYGTPETTFDAGDLLVVDKDRCPQAGEIVVMCRDGGAPFGRLCHVPPAPKAPRRTWGMGVLDDAGTVHLFDLGVYAWFGVVVGRVPVADRRDEVTP